MNDVLQTVKLVILNVPFIGKENVIEKAFIHGCTRDIVLKPKDEVETRKVVLMHIQI